MPPLFDERFVMTVVFVQNSTTYVMDVNTKLEGKCKLNLPSTVV